MGVQDARLRRTLSCRANRFVGPFHSIQRRRKESTCGDETTARHRPATTTLDPTRPGRRRNLEQFALFALRAPRVLQARRKATLPGLKHPCSLASREKTKRLRA